MKRSLTLPTLIALLFLTGATAERSYALDVYVSTSSQLVNACQNAATGHVIKIAAGTYNGPFSLNGKTGVTLKSYNGTVILKGHSDPNTNGFTILTIQNSSNIIVQSLKFTENWGNGANGIVVSGSGTGVTIQNCELFKMGWTTNAATKPISSQNAHAIYVVGLLETPYRSIIIKNNSIHDCITGYSESLTVTGNVSNFTIEGNSVRKNTNIGIDCAGHYKYSDPVPLLNYARYGKVKNNTVSDYAGPVDFPAGAGIYADGSSFITIENNLVYNYRVGISVGCESSNKQNSGNILRNNRIYNNALGGIFVGSSPASNSKVIGTRITNNTLYKNGTVVHNGEIYFLNNVNTVISNNIFYPPNDLLAFVQSNSTGSTTIQISYNLYYRDNGTIAAFYNPPFVDNNFIKSNPLFILAPYNFHVKGTSAAINRGDPNFTGLGLLDVDAQARVLDGRVDIGVDEVALTPPAPPSGLILSASYSSILLRWRDNSNSETGFRIQRSTGTSTTFTTIATVGVGVTSYNNIGLATNTRYNYRVRAYNTTGTSAYTAASAKTIGLAPAIVTSVAKKPATSFDDNNLKTLVYPNPVTSELTINVKSVGSELMVKILDVNGRVLKVSKFAGANQLKYNVSTLKPGEYLLQLNTAKSTEVVKFIKL